MFSVTVKAKPVVTTESTTAATTELKLTDVEVAAEATEIYEKGGQTKINVTAVPAEVALPAVSYSSSNEQVATVKDGVVTGVNAGVAVITVVAGEFTKTVTITVKEKIDAKISLDITSKTLYVGNTLTIKETVEGEDAKNMKTVWTSSDEKVATVVDGVVTAVAAGNATITATVGTTNIQATCDIIVKDDAPGIVDFKATHADTLTVALSAPVAKDDQAKVKVSLKAGSNDQTFTIKWAEDGKSFDLVKNSAYGLATYVVAIEGTDVTFDPNKNNATFELKDKATISAIVIDSTAAMKSSSAIVKYTVKDQYGDPMKNVAGSEFSWSVTSSNNKVKIEPGDISTPREGELQINLNKSELIADTDNISISAYLVKNTAVKSTTTIPVKALAVNSIKIDGIDGEVQELYQKADASQTITLKISGTDTEGQVVDFKKITDYANGSQLVFQSSNAELVTNGENAGDKNLQINEEGKLKVVINQNKSGETVISAMAKDGTPTTFTLKVLATPHAAEVVFTNATASAIANEEAEIPVDIMDQYNHKMDTVTEENFNAAFNIVPLSSYTMASTYPKYSPEKKAILIKTTAPTTKGEIDLQIMPKNVDGKKSNMKVVVKEAASAKIISIGKQETARKIVKNETVDIELEVQDNDGRTYKGSGYRLIANVSDKNYVAFNGFTDVDSKDFTASIDNGKVTVKIKGLDRTQKEQTVKFALYATDGTTKISSQDVVFTFNVYDDAMAYDIKADVADGKYVAGTPITFTITALDAKSNGKTLETYNAEFEDCKFTEAGVESPKSALADVKFVNGVAKVTLTTKTAGTTGYKAIIPTPVKSVGASDDKIAKTVISGLEVKANAAIKFAIVDDKLTALDVQNNVVTDYKGSKTLYISGVSIEGTSASDVTDDGKVIVTFTSGVCSTITKVSGKGTITSKDGAVKGTWE